VQHRRHAFRVAQLHLLGRQSHVEMNSMLIRGEPLGTDGTAADLRSEALDIHAVLLDSEFGVDLFRAKWGSRRLKSRIDNTDPPANLRMRSRAFRADIQLELTGAVKLRIEKLKDMKVDVARCGRAQIPLAPHRDHSLHLKVGLRSLQLGALQSHGSPEVIDSNGRSVRNS